MLKQIFLIGFMGSGKTYTSQLLSKQLQIPCFDLDKIIEESEKKSIQEIFALHKEAYFRQQERLYLKKFIHNNTAFILACGGGTPCFYDNMQTMNQKGLTIWLNENEEIIYNRLLQEKSKRPLIAQLTNSELKKFIENKLSERNFFYKQAKIIIQDPSLLLNAIENYANSKNMD